jgi:hypothetical protein
MLAAIRGFNALVTGLFDLVLWPFSRLAPVWALAIVSVLAGVLMLWLFGKTSNQAAIGVIRDRIRGNLIGVRLFGDDVGQLFRLQGRLLRDNGLYLRHALVPLLVMLPPVVLILVQLELRFGSRPLAPGDTALVKVTLRDAAALEAGVDLEVPEGVQVETPAVRIKALREVSWRVRAERPGAHRLVVRAGAERLEKQLEVGGRWRSMPALRTAHAAAALLHPGEPPLDGNGAIESVEVRYADLPLGRLFGFDLNWLVVFFVLSLAGGFAFRRALGVEI